MHRSRSSSQPRSSAYRASRDLLSRHARFAADAVGGEDSSDAEQARLESDRLKYISFLEGQVARVDHAVARVRDVEEALGRMEDVQASQLSKAQSLAAATTQALEKQFVRLADRLALMELAQRRGVEGAEQRVQQLERVYASFSTPAMAMENAGASPSPQLQLQLQSPVPTSSFQHHHTPQPQHASAPLGPYSSAFSSHDLTSSSSSPGAPGAPLLLSHAAPAAAAGTGVVAALPSFIASFVTATVSSAVASCSRETEQRLGQRVEALVREAVAAQQQQLEQSNARAQEALTQAQNKFAERQADACAAQISTLASEVAEAAEASDARNQARLATAEERWGSMLERWLANLDAQRSSLAEALRASEERTDALSADMGSLGRSLTESDQKAREQGRALAEELATVRAAADAAQQAVHTQQALLEAGMASFNAELGPILSGVEARSHHAEQCVARLSLDTLARQEAFHTKMERFVAQTAGEASSQAKEALAQSAQQRAEARELLDTLVPKVEKEARRTERRVNLLAQVVKERVTDPPLSSSSSSHAVSTYAPLPLPSQVDHLAERVDARLETLREEMSRREQRLLTQASEHAECAARQAAGEVERRVLQHTQRNLIGPLEERLDALTRRSRKHTSSVLAALAASPSSHATPRAISSPDVSSGEDDPVPLLPFGFGKISSGSKSNGRRSRGRNEDGVPNSFVIRTSGSNGSGTDVEDSSSEPVASSPGRQPPSLRMQHQKPHSQQQQPRQLYHQQQQRQQQHSGVRSAASTPSRPERAPYVPQLSMSLSALPAPSLAATSHQNNSFSSGTPPGATPASSSSPLRLSAFAAGPSSQLHTPSRLSAQQL
jgi:hypothetical protein